VLLEQLWCELAGDRFELACELARLGVPIAPSTVCSIPQQTGIEPAPRRLSKNVAGVLASSGARDRRL
jgi:hypothetical protein